MGFHIVPMARMKPAAGCQLQSVPCAAITTCAVCLRVGYAMGALTATIAPMNRAAVSKYPVGRAVPEWGHSASKLPAFYKSS